MNSRKLFTELVLQVNLNEPASEIREKVLLLMEQVPGLTKPKILTGTSINLTPELNSWLRESVSRINNHEPIQYIVGETEFYRRKFKVNSSVLIPRPETEELVQQAISLIESKSNPALLDIGTGSGCIAITLNLELPTAIVYATDVSTRALEVAHENANRLDARVTFLHHNILISEIPFKSLDLIISNPPYVDESEKETLDTNVVKYEPHEALFAPGNPLIFYQAIASKGGRALKPGGLLMVEINERFGTETAAIFSQEGYSTVRIIKDISGKDRFVTAIKPGA
ncbi:MAG: peptide chain release factor N(5)-glutamine methyltransferase [Cyclobacteriaceae bacterium]|nr:peptide chain release factor N(5)-glutamine methyltransferase [Cyclobacteriaceae bacterium]